MSTTTQTDRTVAKIKGENIQCPYCGCTELCDVEDLASSRLVYGIYEDGKLHVSAFAETADEGSNNRLECQECFQECDYPDIEIEYDFGVCEVSQ